MTSPTDSICGLSTDLWTKPYFWTNFLETKIHKSEDRLYLLFSLYNFSRHKKAPCPEKFLIRAEDDFDGSIWEVVRDNKTGEFLKNDGFPIYIGPKIFGKHEVKVMK